MTVRKFLDISTGHVRPDTMDLINSGAMSSNTLAGEHGAMLHVPSEPDLNPNHTADLLLIFEYARKHDCDYVLLDGDAELIDELPDHSDGWK